MISITNIQKNITRAEVWGNIPVLRCGSGSGKPEFFVGGGMRFGNPCPNFWRFCGGGGGGGGNWERTYGGGGGIRLCIDTLHRSFVCTFHVPLCIQYPNKRTQTYNFFCAIFLLTINELCKDEKIF